MQTDEGKKTENNHDRCKTDDEKGWTVCKMSDTPARTPVARVRKSHGRSVIKNTLT